MKLRPFDARTKGQPGYSLAVEIGDSGGTAEAVVVHA